MKKKLLLILIIISFIGGCERVDKSNANDGIKDYTFLIYMNGSDLESENNAGTSDLYEMMKVGSNNKINVVIETGGTKDWKNYYIDASQNQRWMIEKNHMEKIMNLGAKNMGQADTLKDFIVWGIKNYPAKKYALILWNHGGGAISGFGYDEKFNYDTLLLVELRNALKEAYETTKTKFEIIGFDACLMSSLETADMVSPYTKYLVASTELEPSIGWEYTSFLQECTDNELDGEQLGKSISDNFFQAAKKQKLDELATLSVIDTGKVAIVKTNFETFLKKANKEISNMEEYNNLSKSISKSEYYGGQTQEEGFSNMIDLGDIANHLDSDYSTEKSKILDSIKKAVVYEVKGDSKKSSTGLSIYFPYYGKENIEYELPVYMNLDFSDAYNDFLQTYTDMTTKDSEGIATKQGIEKNGSEYRINVDEKDILGISGAHLVLGERVSDNKILMYGGSPVTDIGDDGEVSSVFEGKWLTLNGKMMYFCITKATDDYATYSIPVTLNGEYCNIRVLWHNDGTEDGSYEILGAWHGVIPEIMVVRKEIIRVKSGDVVEPMYPLYDINNKQSKMTNGKAFTIIGQPKIELSPLSKGKDKQYVLGFCLDDCAQNRCFTEFIDLE